MTETLKKHNAKQRGIYFVVNHGGHEDSDITRINAQFMECDDLSFDKQLYQIEEFPIEPSLIIKTQKSLHTYWLMKDAEVSAFRRVQKRLIAQFDGDKTCINESRVLRLPGFNHCKGEPVMVECVKFNPELRYTQAELEAVLPQVEDEPAKGSSSLLKDSRKGLTLVQLRCDFIKHCRENAAALPEHDWYAMITNRAVFEDGDKAIHTLSEQYPKYQRQETQRKIQHFLESGTKPMTCKTIAEKGFQCPRIDDGNCGCKAPAALCYKPLSVEELRVFLSEIEVKKVAVDDMQNAQDFVKEYVYNIEAVIAEIFINYEIKSHFGLKASDVKPLIALHKDICKKYMDCKETRRETSEIELPEWYEVTEHGGLRFISGLLANHMAVTVDAFYGAGSYYFYQHGVYGASEDLWAAAKAREFMIPRYASMTAINDTVGQWKMLIRKPVREINCNPFMINVQNGLYNVLDDGFKPHTPKYYSTVQMMAAYRKEAKCPHYLAFLKSILQEEETYLMQEVFGYLLIPVNKANILRFAFYPVYPVYPVRWFCSMNIMAEKSIVTAILKHLKTVPDCFCWKTHGGLYGAAGLPDIICCTGGRFVAFEVKTPSGKLTKLQETMIQRIRKAKGKAYKVSSVEEVISILEHLEGELYGK
ncbi:MAG: hypothetical protein DDT33_00600 [Firmicutes bacterium]|nr:hypothetical protein [Bacillota bacterium]